jgi:hypothetical protein
MPRFGNTVRRIYSKFSQPGPAPPVLDAATLPTILRAPVDILYYIGSSDALSVADKAALALTCKAFWAVLDGRELLEKLRHKALIEERLSLLERLEVWFPNHTLDLDGFFYLPYSEGKRPHRVTWTPESATISFRLWRIQQVMKRHRLGKKYGLPIKDAELSSQNDGCTVSVRAAIIDDELVMRFDMSRLTLRRTYKEMGSRFPLLRSAVGVGGIPTKLEEVFGKCDVCSDEFRWACNPLYGARHCEETSTIWRNVGKCRKNDCGFGYLAKKKCCYYALRAGSPGHTKVVAAEELRYIKGLGDKCPGRLRAKANRIHRLLAFRWAHRGGV